MRSMTGYGRGIAQNGPWEITVELRSVNHRFLDVSCRLPRNLSFLEDAARKALTPLQRGHVDVLLSARRTQGAERQVEIDEALAAAYAQAGRRLAESVGAADDLTAAKLLTLEGVATITEAAMEEDAVTQACLAAMAEAVEQLQAMRLREGEHLQADLTAHLNAAEALRVRIAARAPLVVEEYRQRLTERLAKLPVEPVEPQRLAQEVALMADRCAIDEELSRLDSHIAQMRQYLGMDGEIGKKLDFLIQEMNREANTIASKANDAFIAQCAVDLKSEIEKLREQVQNVV